MRILACADLHGIAERMVRLRQLVGEHQPDVVVLAGDLGGWGGEGETLAALDPLITPVLAIGGNMDGPGIVSDLARRGWLLGGEPIVFGGISFGSVSVLTPCDVLVAHIPPRGTLDVAPNGEHIGSRKVRDAIEQLHPRVVVCGHVHETPGIERTGDTLVVNCSTGAGKAQGALIEIEGEKVSARLV
jgi:Icc-related predicted phosphoesterase